MDLRFNVVIDWLIMHERCQKFRPTINNAMEVTANSNTVQLHPLVAENMKQSRKLNDNYEYHKVWYTILILPIMKRSCTWKNESTYHLKSPKEEEINQFSNLVIGE